MGAALGTVGGACDRIFDLGPIKESLGEVAEGELEHKAREVALAKGRDIARAEVIKKGWLFLFTCLVFMLTCFVYSFVNVCVGCQHDVIVHVVDML